MPELPDVAALLEPLLHQAGLSQPVRSVNLLTEQGVTNRMSLVTLSDGTQLMLRVYHWPWGGSDYDRLHKEKFLHEQLRQHGVPVARFLVDLMWDEYAVAPLEYLPGEPLGEQSLRLSSSDRVAAWRSCGEMLRRAHTITYPRGTYGVIVGTDVLPFNTTDSAVWQFDAPSWGHFHVGMIFHHFERLRQRRAGLSGTYAQLQDLLGHTISFLNRTLPVLLHNDAHPWNVLIYGTEQGWRCSGWIDWEYAWVGDPTWDLVRMDLFRRKPLGPTPDAFWEGYGAAPHEPERSVYELHIQLWMANQYLDGDRQLMPTYAAAMQYVERLREVVRALEQQLA